MKKPTLSICLVVVILAEMGHCKTPQEDASDIIGDFMKKIDETRHRLWNYRDELVNRTDIVFLKGSLLSQITTFAVEQFNNYKVDVPSGSKEEECFDQCWNDIQFNHLNCGRQLYNFCYWKDIGEPEMNQLYTQMEKTLSDLNKISGSLKSCNDACCSDNVISSMVKRQFSIDLDERVEEIYKTMAEQAKEYRLCVYGYFEDCVDKQMNVVRNVKTCAV